jgi:hypothetical protein
MISRKTTLFFAVSALIIVAVSCKKDNITPDSLTGTYVGSNAIVVSEIKMFTVAGEVTKRSLIDNFLKGADNPFTSPGKQSNNGDDIEIDFSNKGTAIVTSKSNSNLDPLTFTMTEKTDKSFVLVSPQSYSYRGPLTDDILYKIFYASNQINQFSNCKEKPLLQAKICDFTKKLPFEIIFNRIYALSYSFYVMHNSVVVSTGEGNMSTGYYKDVQGIFNDAAIKLLSKNDTLLVQTKHWEIVKKN